MMLKIFIFFIVVLLMFQFGNAFLSTDLALGETSDIEGNFDGVLHDGDHFGVSVTTIGDLNNDGIVDLAVGAKWDDGGGKDRGAIWILFLDSTGKVKDYQKISNYQGAFEDNILFNFFKIVKEWILKIIS